AKRSRATARPSAKSARQRRHRAQPWFPPKEHVRPTTNTAVTPRTNLAAKKWWCRERLSREKGQGDLRPCLPTHRKGWRGARAVRDRPRRALSAWGQATRHGQRRIG